MLSPQVSTYLQEKKKERASPILFNPCTRKREHGAPVQGAGLGGGSNSGFATYNEKGLPGGEALLFSLGFAVIG